MSVSSEHPLLAVLQDPALRRLAARWVKNPEDIDDVLQNVALKLLGQPRDALHPQHYVRRSVRNMAIDHARARLSRADRESGRPLETETLHQDAESARLVDDMEQALAGLPALTAEMFRMHYVEGREQREIAAHFDVHLSTVEKRLKAAKRVCMSAMLNQP